MNLSEWEVFLLKKMKNLQKIATEKKPIYKKIAEDEDFFALFQKIDQEFETCFVFESLGEEGKFSRYSIIGFDPETLVSAKKKKLFINGNTFLVNNPYYALREIMPEQVISREFAGGLVG